MIEMGKRIVNPLFRLYIDRDGVFRTTYQTRMGEYLRVMSLKDFESLEADVCKARIELNKTNSSKRN